MRTKLKIITFLSIFIGAYSCASVKEYQKMYVTDRDMEVGNQIPFHGEVALIFGERCAVVALRYTGDFKKASHAGFRDCCGELYGSAARDLKRDWVLKNRP